MEDFIATTLINSQQLQLSAHLQQDQVSQQSSDRGEAHGAEELWAVDCCWESESHFFSGIWPELAHAPIDDLIPTHVLTAISGFSGL